MIGNAIRLFRENRVLLVVCLVIMVNQLGFGIIVPVTPIYARTFGVNEGAIGLVIAVYGLGRFLFSVPVGQAADRFGRKPIILAGAARSGACRDGGLGDACLQNRRAQAQGAWSHRESPGRIPPFTPGSTSLVRAPEILIERSGRVAET